MPPTPKYHGEQDPAAHGGPLVWPGGPRGYPLRLDGARPSVPMPRQADFDRTRVVLDFKARAFRTWDAASLADYVAIMDRIGNRQFFLRHQERQYVPEQGGWLFWVEWLQPYETPAPAGYPR